MENHRAISNEKKIALFFFFIFLDDQLAARATARALDHLKRQTKKRKSDPLTALTDEDLISVSMKIYSDMSRISSGAIGSHSAEAWHIPKNVDLGPWRQFRKQVDIEDVITVAWAQILDVPTGAIAQGMNVSEGTVLYRLATGLKVLGTISPLGGSRA